MSSISRRHFTLCAGAASLGFQPWRLAMSATAASGDMIDFTAYRNGDWFGHHRLAFNEQDGKLTVDIEIDFLFKIAFIPLYRYRHRNREVWADGRLIEITTETDDNGTPYKVTGKAEGDRLLVDGSDGKLDLPGDTASTSYWNEETIERGEWLDTQHGRLASSKVTRKKTDPILVEGTPIQANAYHLEGEITCTLWYHDQRWVGLRFSASDESVIDYSIEPPGQNG